MSVKDDLIAAKALIDAPEKWWRGVEDAPCNGRHCVITASTDAAPNRWLPVVRLLGTTLDGKIHAGAEARELAAFNDATDTTHADIMALFDRAIEAAK